VRVRVCVCVCVCVCVWARSTTRAAVIGMWVVQTISLLLQPLRAAVQYKHGEREREKLTTHSYQDESNNPFAQEGKGKWNGTSINIPVHHSPAASQTASQIGNLLKEITSWFSINLTPRPLLQLSPQSMKEICSFLILHKQKKIECNLYEHTHTHTHEHSNTNEPRGLKRRPPTCAAAMKKGLHIRQMKRNPIS
jgi:hypothetical protein